MKNFKNYQLSVQGATADVNENMNLAEVAIAGSPEKAESEKEVNKTPLITWGILAVLYFVWNWIDDRETIKESVQPANVKANFRTLAVTTLGVLIFGNLVKILVGKLAETKIPILNKIAGSILPLLW